MIYASDKQPPGEYPPAYPAVLPQDIAPYNCDHDDDEKCFCAHDWRIFWGNPPRVNQRRSVYVTDSP